MLFISISTSKIRARTSPIQRMLQQVSCQGTPASKRTPREHVQILARWNIQFCPPFPIVTHARLLRSLRIGNMYGGVPFTGPRKSHRLEARGLLHFRPFRILRWRSFVALILCPFSLCGGNLQPLSSPLVPNILRG